MLFRHKLFNSPKKFFAKNIDPSPTLGENKHTKTKSLDNAVQVLKSENNEVKTKGSVSTKQHSGSSNFAQKGANSIVRKDAANKPSALIAAKIQCSEWYSPNLPNASHKNVTSSPKARFNHTSTPRPSQTAMTSSQLMDHPAFRSSLYCAPNNLKSVNLNKAGKPRRFGPPNGRNLRVVGRILYSIQETEENHA